MYRTLRHFVRLTALVLAVVPLSACLSLPEPPVQAEYKPTLPPMPVYPPPTSGSLYRAGGAVMLFEDSKALQVGDILTIVLTEKTQASKSSKTKSSKDTSIDTGTPTLFGRGVTVNGNNVLSVGIESQQSFEGAGDSEQKNSLSGTISVTVSQVLPNGNLVVRGQKWLVLNQGEEIVQVSGIVRPQDVAPDNSVPSTLLADARIVYTGRGALADANQMGWLARFFNGPLWPF